MRTCAHTIKQTPHLNATNNKHTKGSMPPVHIHGHIYSYRDSVCTCVRCGAVPCRVRVRACVPLLKR